jgi:arsenate reductase-like glutaredoxin family protein
MNCGALPSSCGFVAGRETERCISKFSENPIFRYKKSERYFKERRIKFQSVDLLKFGMSRGELASVAAAAGLEALVDWENPDAALLRYLATTRPAGKALGKPPSSETPVVRNGRRATVGYRPRYGKRGNNGDITKRLLQMPLHFAAAASACRKRPLAFSTKVYMQACSPQSCMQSVTAAAHVRLRGGF